MNIPTVISLFSGMGGSSLGYHMAGFREILAVERNRQALKVFRENFHDVEVFDGDIRNLTNEQCLALAQIRPGELSLLDSSCPCQGFSTSGKRDFDDPRNSLYREAIRLLKALQPQTLVFENVIGMIKGEMRAYFATILQQLKGCGYRVRAWRINAKNCGVPQDRERIIIIGVRDDLGIEPSSPPLGSLSSGCVRLDSRPHKKPNRFGAKLIEAGSIARTLCCKDSFYWNEDEEWGVRSYAAVCGFPLSFKLNCSRCCAVQLLGNAVPPPMMFRIADHIKCQVLEKKTVRELRRA